MDQLEGRNVVLECLVRGRRRVRRIEIDRGAKPEARLDQILSRAEGSGIPVERVERPRLDRAAEGRVHNGIIAWADPLPPTSLEEVLDQCALRGEHPLILLTDGLTYEHNLGAVLRSCLGFGAHALVIPTRRGARLSPVVQRVAMGAAEVVPVVEEGLFSAVKKLERADIPLVGADMDGVAIASAPLAGPLAIVVGEEGRGLSPRLRERCRTMVRVPLAGNLESLNASVAAAVLLYEKRRQDGWMMDSSSP